MDDAALRRFARRVCHVFLSICAAAAVSLITRAEHRVRSAAPQSARTVIWILGADGRLSAYDAADFHLRIKNAAPFPADARAHPDSISISRSGLVLYAKAAADSGRMQHWSLWRDGHSRELIAASDETHPAPGGGSLVTRSTPIARLSTDGRRIFWFENQLTVLEGQNRLEITQTGKFLVWTTDLGGGDRKALVELPLPRCACGTGVCEETCPQIDAWSPPGGVSDFFFLTKWIPGQIGSDFLETDLFRERGGTWTARKLPAPVYSFLDAANHGHAYIGAIPDAGCCGWENESDDRTYLVRDGKQVTVFDERARFHNGDYDVSFFTSSALLSPSAIDVAYTIISTFRPGQTIRLSDGGKSNPEELRQIHAAIGRMPQVEVEALSNPSKPRFALPKTELIGWLDARRLLVWQQSRLLVVDAISGQVAPTALAAAKPGDVFLQ